MPVITPETYTSGALTDATLIEADCAKLRAYVNGIIPSTNFTGTPFIETQDIRQPAITLGANGRDFTFEGISTRIYYRMKRGKEEGFQAITTFGTSMGHSTTEPGEIWRDLPNSTFRIWLPRNAFVTVHYMVEGEVGPQAYPSADDASIWQVREEDRAAYLCPYFGEQIDASTYVNHVQSCYQNMGGYEPAGTNSVVGAAQPYSFSGYFRRSGILIEERQQGEVRFALATTATCDRSIVINYSILVVVEFV